MTIHVIVAINDRAVKAFNRPFFVPSIGWAMRSFQDEVNRGAADNLMYHHPEDYELWVMGEFNDETGLFKTDTQACIARGKQVKQAPGEQA